MGTIWHSELVHSFIRWAHLATYCHIKAMMYVQVHYYVANSTGDMSMTVRSITWCVALIVRCTNFSIRLSKISSDLNKGAIKLIVATFKNAHIKHIHRAHSLATIHIAYKMGILTKFRFFFLLFFYPLRRSTFEIPVVFSAGDGSWCCCCFYHHWETHEHSEKERKKKMIS